MDTESYWFDFLLYLFLRFQEKLIIYKIFIYEFMSWPSNTTGILKFAECFYVCRVYFLRHSANKFFAEWCAKNTRQKKTLGKDGVCRVSKKTLGKESVCRVLKKHLSKK